jgi:acyl-CoA thioesterase FadM
MSSTLSSLKRWIAALLPAATIATGGALVAFFAVETHKSWPLSYHIRLLLLLLRCRLFPRKLHALDVPIIYRSKVRLSDLDYHGHVNNAQYALDADLFGRYPWMSAVLMNTGTPFRANAFIGGAMYFFQRELRWGMRYRVETQAVAVDEKWLFVESRWYVEGEGKADVLATVKVTRFVFKEGSGPLRGKTIPPRDALRDLGLAVPASFDDASRSRIGHCFSEAYEIATGSESGMRQEQAGDCSCSTATTVHTAAK